MRSRRLLGSAFLVLLSACQSQCSCNASGGDGDGGNGGSTTTTTGQGGGTTSAGGAGQGGNTASAGGAGQGGNTTSAGGAGQGGNTTSAGGAGQGGSGQGGGGQAAAECVTAEDCRLVNDCCTCDAIPASQDPELCEQDCVISSCDSLGLPADAPIACAAGQCVAGFVCDWALAECDIPPPDCPEGMTASVEGGCFGSCVPSTECLSVGSCDQCDGGLSCVRYEAFTTEFHCVDSAPCAADDCGCLGPAVCDPGSDVCNEDADGIVCSCITC